MGGMETCKTTISCEQKVGIQTGEMRVSIECDAIHGYKDRLRKVGVMEEFHEVGAMKGHGERLYYSNPIPLSFIPPRFHHLQMGSTKEETEGDKALMWNAQTQ
jgi:hypothetical protein